MATRPVFYVKNNNIYSKDVEFEWFAGFAVSQKQKSITSLHSQLDGRALEISTKSKEELGCRLSAFNLKLNGYTLENIFQSSKKFEKGGPYRDLLEVPPKDAKRDERLQSSGSLVSFEYDNESWPLNPKTLFYDYIYCRAVRQSLTNEEICIIAKYEYFTDIEFNPKKSINTQARTVALIKIFINMFGELPEFSKEDFIKFHT